MQFHNNPKLRLSAIALACQFVCFSAAYAQTAMESSESVNKDPNNKVTITGAKVGTGLMVQEDAPKARSTITEEELRKQRPSGNVYQSLELMPAVNTYNHDATGLFGGGLTMRGFNSDQIGATINGVPVNDSGSYSVFPQEYTDNENLCQTFVTQGSTDVESPHVGATGGNIGLVTCAPLNQPRVRIAQTVGQLYLSRTFARVDTGLWADGRSKFFISGSHTQSDKWKGPGEAKRDHVDIGYNWDADRFNYVHAALLYNQAFNNNIYNPTLAELKANGYTYDYSPNFLGRLAGVKGTAQKEAFTQAYYRLSNNPFENIVASATIAARVGDNLDIKVVPYFWYGYGTGGTQEKTLSESGFLNVATGKTNAAVDLNGDGDTLDTVIVAGSSVTHTLRPGVTASAKYQIGDHEIFTGVWYERAKHRQTGPAVLIDANGEMTDTWLRSNWIRRPDGSPYESRDWLTVSPAWQYFLQDTVSLMNDKLLINVGVRTPHIRRELTNYASEATPAAYTFEKTYSDVLPQVGVRYRINNDNQIFGSLAKNMKTPPNFAFTGSNINVVNGVANVVNTPEAETSWNLDIGYRHQSNFLTTQASIYFIDFRNRQANAFDPVSQKNIYTNAGDVKSHGFELEAGNTPINGWSFYGSMSYNKSEIQQDLRVTTTGTLPTKGKEFPLAPKFKLGLSAQYESGAWYARVKARHTSTQQATLANDEEVPAYTVADFDAGYNFGAMGLAKNVKLTFNVSNLFNEEYRNPSSVNTNGTVINGVNPATIRYYLGAPRFASVSLTADF